MVDKDMDVAVITSPRKDVDGLERRKRVGPGVTAGGGFEPDRFLQVPLRVGHITHE